LESTEIFGLLKAQLEIAGSRLDGFDLIIASCAMAHNLTMVTNNTKHFPRSMGLNWRIGHENLFDPVEWVE
jgi:predicted nucleic acid-binding protein